MTDPAHLLKPGQIFAGRYRIERFLAQGGFGQVFVAEDSKTKNSFAVKVLWPHLAAAEGIRERFELEATVGGRAKTDHIVRVYDTGVDEETGMPFLVMELLEGLSFSDHVRRHGPMPPLDVAEFVAQVARGLDKAHGYVDRATGKTKPIVHRDLKPENLFLALREDGQRVAKVLDFGVAKVLSDSTQMSREIRGTPLYLASEQALGEEITPRTDIWALGLVVFYMLTGKSYWLRASGGTTTLPYLLSQITHDPIVTPTERARQLAIQPAWPPEFDAWFLRCVDRRPERRFASAGEAASVLAMALLGEDAAASITQVATLESLRPPGPGEIVGGATADPVASTAVPTQQVPSRRPALIALVFLVLGGLAYAGLRSVAPSAPDEARALPPLPEETANGAHSVEATVARSAAAPPPSAAAVPSASAGAFRAAGLPPALASSDSQAQTRKRPPEPRPASPPLPPTTPAVGPNPPKSPAATRAPAAAPVSSARDVYHDR